MGYQTIFVQIAAYRDPQLIPTLESMFSNAKWPERLKVCVAWQHTDEEAYQLTWMRQYPQIKVLELPAELGRGACWARHLIQRCYNGETYTLQLDSHHRFAKHWDKTLISLYKELEQEAKKPLITAYLPAYHIDETQPWTQDPWQMNADVVDENKIVLFRPGNIPMERRNKRWVRARFYSGHFAFTTGKFCVEVPHDPDLYFHGEEISISLRAFTKGYDLFHPTELIAWHEYTREGRVKHWDDNKSNTVDTWHLYDKASKRHWMHFLAHPNWGPFGLGHLRSKQDYEKFAAVNFKLGTFLEEARTEEPILQDFKSIELDKDWLSDVQNLEFIAIVLVGEENRDVSRRDLSRAELSDWLMSDKSMLEVQVSHDKPVTHAIVWPHYKTWDKTNQKINF